MTVQEIIERARRCLNKGCAYALGRGGFDPALEFPWSTSDLACDCSGYVAWCLGHGRQTDHPWYRATNGGWFETSAVFRDAMTAGYGMFDLVHEPAVGDLIVYGDTPGPEHHQGHVGLVVAVDPTSVIHCSHGAYAKSHDAISETGPGLWLSRGGIYARTAPIT